MHHIAKILTTACFLAGVVMLLAPASAAAKGHGSLAKNLTNHASSSFAQTKATPKKTTISKTKLLTLTIKGSQLKQPSPIKNSIVDYKHHRRYREFCWDLGYYLGGWDPDFVGCVTNDALGDAQQTAAAAKTVAAAPDSSNDDSDDSGDVDDGDVDGICAN
jgi:hypothetical protein